MIEKTKDYSIFKFRDDNREKIQKAHIQRLMESIKKNNMLKSRPILVNSDMEILDGQHRFMAAKNLGVEIYYEVHKEMNDHDIILLNIAKNWTLQDYFNFYKQHGYAEYIKLDSLMKKNSIQFNIAYSLTAENSRDAQLNFRSGKFKLKEKELEEYIDLAKESISIIKNIKGAQTFYDTQKFWKALITVFRHPAFDKSIWLKNLPRLLNHIIQQVTIGDYIKTFSYIYNYKKTNTLEFKTH